MCKLLAGSSGFRALAGLLASVESRNVHCGLKRFWLVVLVKSWSTWLKVYRGRAKAPHPAGAQLVMAKLAHVSRLYTHGMTSSNMADHNKTFSDDKVLKISQDQDPMHIPHS